MNFEGALGEMKTGCDVARLGWKSGYIFIRDLGDAQESDEDIAMALPDDVYRTWNPNSKDLLATDWYIISNVRPY
jgi:hypothetical protein